jgi:hypothetical protein
MYLLLNLIKILVLHGFVDMTDLDLTVVFDDFSIKFTPFEIVYPINVLPIAAG